MARNKNQRGNGGLPDDKYGLIRVLRIQSVGKDESVMKAFIRTELEAMGRLYTEDNVGNILVGGVDDFGPLVVAHMDTVHRIVGNVWEPLKIRHKDGVLTSPTGIGGDDKVGVWAALEALRKYPLCRGAFFTQEESGCVGSGRVDGAWFDAAGIGWCIQADRRGYKDFVVCDWGGYEGDPNLCSWKFIGAVGGIAMAKYGYELCWSGSSTDVYTLSERGVGVSCVNISAGYYGEHTMGERVVLGDAYNCRKLMLEVIGRYGADVFPHERPAKRSWRGGGGRNQWDGYGHGVDDFDDYDDELLSKYNGRSFTPTTPPPPPTKAEKHSHSNVPNFDPFIMNGKMYEYDHQRKVWSISPAPTPTLGEQSGPQVSSLSKIDDPVTDGLIHDLRDRLRHDDLAEDETRSSE